MDAFMYLRVGQQVWEGNKYQETLEDAAIQFEHSGQGDRLSELPLSDSGCPSTVQSPTAWDTDNKHTGPATPICNAPCPGVTRIQAHCMYRIYFYVTEHHSPLGFQTLCWLHV